MHITSKLAHIKRNAERLDVDDVLDLVGLTRKRTFVVAMLPMMGTLLAGIAIGAGIGLLMPPSARRRLRQRAEERVDEIRERVRDRVDAVGGP
jgi:hypothetical protein